MANSRITPLWMSEGLDPTARELYEYYCLEGSPPWHLLPADAQERWAENARTYAKNMRREVTP